MTKTASKIIMPKHIWDGKAVEKQKKRIRESSKSIWIQNCFVSFKIR